MVLRGRRRRRLVGALATWLLLTACGGSSDTPAADGERSGQEPALVATTSIWADVTSRVACGEPVDAIVPAGADPHTFEPSLQDRERLADAGTVIANGGGLEEGVVDLLDTIGADGVDVIELTGHVDLLAGDDGHDVGDPHIWQDPVLVAGLLDVIGDAVVATGRDRVAIDTCVADYRTELATLDADIAAALAPIPDARRVMVTNHDAFEYFAARYGVRIVGTVIPSMSTLGDSSAGQLADLEATVGQYAVPAIFTEALASDADAQALAERLDVDVIALVSDSLSEDGPSSTYSGMMRANAELIAGALG